MFPVHAAAAVAATHGDHNYMTKASKLKEVAIKKSEQVKAQAEQIYQSYSVKNWTELRTISFPVDFQQNWIMNQTTANSILVYRLN